MLLIMLINYWLLLCDIRYECDLKRGCKSHYPPAVWKENFAENP